MAKFGFIGMGNMGYAMLKGLLSVYTPSDIIFTCPDLEKCKRISQETGVRYAESNAECANNAQYVVLAVKPQVYNVVLKNINNVIREDSVVISIAPGISIDNIKSQLGINARVVRAMPNTPALVNEGMSALCPNKNIEDEELKIVKDIFDSFGKSEVVGEYLIDAVIGVSGSSPAYVFMFIEAMADAAVMAGMPRKQAYNFAAQSVLGSAKMVLESGKHPGELKDMVCSPAGTTIDAVKVLENEGMRSAVINAVCACVEKSREMSK